MKSQHGVSDPICRCGHKQSRHYRRRGICEGNIYQGYCGIDKVTGCRRFRRATDEEVEEFRRQLGLKTK